MLAKLAAIQLSKSTVFAEAVSEVILAQNTSSFIFFSSPVKKAIYMTKDNIAFTQIYLFSLSTIDVNVTT